MLVLTKKFLKSEIKIDKPSNYRPDLVKTNHIHLELEINFEKQILGGSATLIMEKVDATGS